jgi:hypothetical protein
MRDSRTGCGVCLVLGVIACLVGTSGRRKVEEGSAWWIIKRTEKLACVCRHSVCGAAKHA